MLLLEDDETRNESFPTFENKIFQDKNQPLYLDIAFPGVNWEQVTPDFKMSNQICEKLHYNHPLTSE